MEPAVATQSEALTTGAPAPKGFIQLREAPDAPDELDGKRLVYFRGMWTQMDELYRAYERQVEENARMLAGQQYSIYHPVLGEWMDLTDLMDDSERIWKPRPVFNRILPWYILTHARMTENPPILTFVPGPDRIDAELAETMDTAQKILWRELGMVDKIDALCGWIIVGARAHLMSRIDPNRGPMKKWIGQAHLPLVDQFGDPIADPEHETGMAHTNEPIPNIPHDAQGQPLARMTPDGPQITGEPHQEPEGQLKVDVYSPLQVRGQWGPTPWHEKRHHQIKTFLTPEEVWELTGVEVEPDTRGGGSASSAGELERILFGTGFYGAAESRLGSVMSASSTEGFVEVLTTWERPCNYGGMEETADSPGGRISMVSRNKVLWDGPRPAKMPYTSPLRTFEFIRTPGRPNATTPQEAMNPAQRSYNEGYRRIDAHVALMTDPVTILDKQSGINETNWENGPGTSYTATRRPNVPAVEFIEAPPLGADVYKLQEMLLRELTDLGNLAGTQGDPPADDASGELIKELRFNSDRFLGPTMRRMVTELGRLVEDWQQLLPIIWDEQKVLQYAGDDNVARTMTVMPYMFQKGQINIVPDVESMLPEGRGDKQARVYKMYMDGLFGIPGSPQAVKQFFELAHFPHLGRTGKFGGIDRITADQENGQLVQGAPPQSIPVYEWYDHDIHLMSHEEFMKSPEYKKLAPPIQESFAFHRQAHKMFQAQMQMRAAQNQAALNGIANPQPQPGAGGGGAPGAKGGPPDTSLQPRTPTPPTGGVPGGRMPTSPQGAGVT